MGIFSRFRRSKHTDSKHRDSDQLVLDQLHKAGSDLSRPHPVEFFLYFPGQDAADQAAVQILNAGLEVTVRRSAKGDEWLCFAIKNIVPELAILQKIRTDFDALAARLGGDYDGWGTPVVE
jgi:regulator of RNase E activity RraB